MKELASFMQTNGFPCSIDPDTVGSVKGIGANKEHDVRTIITHGPDGGRTTTVTTSHDAVMESLRATGIANMVQKA